MSDETTDQIADLQVRLLDKVDEVLDWADSAETFVADQAPLVVNEMITWANVYMWMMWIMCGAVLVLALILCMASFRFCVRADDTGDKAPEAASILTGVLGITFLLVVLGYGIAGIRATGEAIKANTAPRLYVIEQLHDRTK